MCVYPLLHSYYFLTWTIDSIVLLHLPWREEKKKKNKMRQEKLMRVKKYEREVKVIYCWTVPGGRGGCSPRVIRYLSFCAHEIHWCSFLPVMLWVTCSCIHLLVLLYLQRKYKVSSPLGQMSHVLFLLFCFDGRRGHLTLRRTGIN